MSYLSQKDASIQQLVQQLRDSLGAGSFDVADNWESDPFAIGIVNTRDSRVLAYVSLQAQAPKPYFVSFELPPAGEWSDHPYTPTGEVSVETFEELVDLLRAHDMGSAA